MTGFLKHLLIKSIRTEGAGGIQEAMTSSKESIDFKRISERQSTKDDDAGFEGSADDHMAS